MSILHRIFVSRHKRKKLYKKQKATYKKFLGLKPVTGLFFTAASRPAGVRLSKKLPKSAVRKPTPSKPSLRLRFSILRLLSTQDRRAEVISAQNDIANFINAENDTPIQNTSEKFQAFLPQLT